MSGNRPPGAGDAELARGLAVVDQLRNAGRSGDAEQTCRNLVTAYPSSAGALNCLALLVKARGQFDEAETLLRRALVAAPREAALHNNFGNLLRRKNDLAGAEAAFRRALSLNRDYPDAYYNLGVTLQDQHRDDEALAALRRAVALRPAYPDALAQLGALLIEKKESTEALTRLDAALRANARHFGAHYYRGRALTELERYDDAIGALRQAAALRPDSYEAYFALGNTLVRAHREDEALDAYRHVVDLAPEFLQAHYQHNLVAWTMGRTDLAYVSYARARDLVGEKPDLLLAEASLRLRLKDTAAAEDLARRASKAAPERRDIVNLLAQTLTAQQRYEESISLLETAIRAEPEQVLHHRELGIAYLQSRQPGAARRVLEDALRHAPSDQLILAHLALAYRESGDSRFHELVDIEKHVSVYEVPPPDGLGDTEAFNRVFCEELQRLHTRRVEPFDQTLRGGTQTPGHLFASNIPAIALFRERIADVVAEYIRGLPDNAAHPFLRRKTGDFIFSGSWSCRLRSNGFHTNHVHPEGWISSAYYVSVPDAVAGADQQGWLKFGESNLDLGEQDHPVRKVKPAVGKLVLFPSYYWHGTVPFVDDGVRLTVAFDVAPRA